MKKYIYLTALLISLAVSSCITQQKCNERFPPKGSDSIDTVISYQERLIHDTILFEPREVVIHDSIPCPDLEYHKQTSNKGLKQTIDIHKGVITAECKDDSLQREINRLNKEKITRITDNRKQIVNTTTNILKWWQKALIICGWLFIVVLIVVLIALFFKIVK